MFILIKGAHDISGYQNEIELNLKQEFFLTVAMSVLLFSCTTWTSMKHSKKKLCSFKQILVVAPYKTAIVWSLTSHLTSHSHKTNKTCWELLEKWRWTHNQSSLDFYIWICHCKPTSKKLHSSALCRHWMLSKGLTKSDGW